MLTVRWTCTRNTRLLRINGVRLQPRHPRSSVCRTTDWPPLSWNRPSLSKCFSTSASSGASSPLSSSMTFFETFDELSGKPFDEPSDETSGKRAWGSALDPAAQIRYESVINDSMILSTILSAKPTETVRSPQCFLEHLSLSRPELIN